MPTLDRIVTKITSNERIDETEALHLLQEADLLTLGGLAHQKRLQRHPQPVVTFVIDRNINYTNICMSECLFCAFYRHEGQDGAYVISKAVLQKKIEETLALGGTQILLQGGMNPGLELSYYLDLLEFIKTRFPIHIHGFSPPEIDFLAQKANLTLEETLRLLMAAGLGSIPGGGAEILADDIRGKISPNKCSAQRWLEVMRTAHRLGLRSTATMMFGHLEEPRHVIEHLIRIRNLQDETKGFTAFIPWTFQPANTKIKTDTATAVDYLRVLAVSRLVLDNIDNIQASWVTQGEKIAQVSLAFGANDFGSTMIEENVVAAAGVNFRLPLKQMIRLIVDAGYQACQRDCFYHILKTHSGDQPDA